MSDQFLHVPLAEIVASLTNPRTSFNEQTLAELAEDIKARGVDSPVLLRPLPGTRVQDTDRKVKYEIVFGERRFRASQLAGMATIPARVRDLTDAEALVAQLVENLGRDDITALEEAEGIRRLMDAEQINVDEVAIRIKKSRRHVYNQLKLLELCTEAKDALRTGKIDPSRGLLIARIPDDKLQLKALEAATKPNWQDEPPSVRDLQRWIRHNVMLELEHAVFKITDARLVETAGSCTDCPKRTGANPDLFHDVDGADICTDPGCFHGKEDAHRAQLVKKAETKGLRIVEGKEAQELMDGYTYHDTPPGYVSLSDKRPDLCEEGAKPITLAKALGDDAPAPILFIHPRTQVAMELVPEAEAEAVLVAKGLMKAEDATAASDQAQSLEEQLKDVQADIARETERAQHTDLYDATLKAIQQAPAAKAKLLLTGEILRSWLLAELDYGIDVDEMADIIGLEFKDGDDEMDAVTQRIHRLGDTDLIRAAAGCMLRTDRYYHSNSTTPVLDAAVKALEVDAKAIKRATANRIKANRAGQLKNLQDKIDAKKAPTATASAARREEGAGGSKPKAPGSRKAPPAAAGKISAQEAKQGIADALQGIEGSASAPKGAVAPTALQLGALLPQDAWPFPNKRESAPAQPVAPAAKAPAAVTMLGVSTDPMYAKARALVLKQQAANQRMLKEGLSIGQAKADALLAQLEAAGVIGPAIPRQPREVLLDKKGNPKALEAA